MNEDGWMDGYGCVGFWGVVLMRKQQMGGGKGGGGEGEDEGNNKAKTCIETGSHGSRP